MAELKVQLNQAMEYLACRGQILLTNKPDITLSTSYAKINGTATWSNPEEKRIIGDGNKLTVPEDGVYLLIGSSDLKLSGTATNGTVFYNAYVNGVDIGDETKHTFSSKDVFHNISINTYLSLTANQYIEIFTKADGDNQINVNSLSVTLTKV